MTKSNYCQIELKLQLWWCVVLELLGDHSALLLSGSWRAPGSQPISMEGREMLCLCLVHQRSLLLCAAASDSSRAPLSLAEQPPPPPLRAAPCFVCWVLLCTETVAANCVCFLSSPTSPNILLFLTPPPLPPPPLQPFLFLNFPPSSCCSCIFLNAPHPTPPYPTPVCWPLLCCGGPQKRSGQMVSDDFRALLISTGNSLVLLLAWSSLRVSACPKLLTFIPFNLN